MLGDRGLHRTLSTEAQSAYLDSRAAGAKPDRFEELLHKTGTTGEVLPGDEIPEGWLPGGTPPCGEFLA